MGEQNERLKAVGGTAMTCAVCAALMWLGYGWVALLLACAESIVWCWLAASYRQIAHSLRDALTPHSTGGR